MMLTKTGDLGILAPNIDLECASASLLPCLRFVRVSIQFALGLINIDLVLLASLHYIA